jgi:hypothetical protein
MLALLPATIMDAVRHVKLLSGLRESGVLQGWPYLSG